MGKCWGKPNSEDDLIIQNQTIILSKQSEAQMPVKKVA